MTLQMEKQMIDVKRPPLAEAIRDLSPLIHTHDSIVGVWLEESGPLFPVTFRVYKRIERWFERNGFTVTECKNTVKNYRCLRKYYRRRCLRKYYRRAVRDDLKVRLNCSGRHVEVLFFQDVANIDNPNGGEYVFDHVKKMPYVVRLRFTWAQRRLLKYLASLGFAIQPQKKTIEGGHSPLEDFNDSWDGEYEKRRGVHRFERDETGWPSAKELRSWPRKDGDGVIVNQGDWKYVRVNGRWCRCQVYGGINGMWMSVSAGRRLWQSHVSELRTNFPGRGRIFDKHSIIPRLNRLLAKAIEAKDFLRCHEIQKAIGAAS